MGTSLGVNTLARMAKTGQKMGPTKDGETWMEIRWGGDAEDVNSKKSW